MNCLCDFVGFLGTIARMRSQAQLIELTELLRHSSARSQMFNFGSVVCYLNFSSAVDISIFSPKIHWSAKRDIRVKRDSVNCQTRMWVFLH